MIRKSARSQSSGSPVHDGNVSRLVRDVVKSPGQPLDTATRTFFESRFHHDFSRIRVHTDARASASANAIHALAYTAGQDLVFGAGQFAPGATAGRRLLAHELTHVAQQGDAPSSDDLNIGPAHDAGEREANDAADAVISGIDVGYRSTHLGGMIQRQPDTRQVEKKEKPKEEITIKPATRTIEKSELAKAGPLQTATSVPDTSPKVKGKPTAEKEEPPPSGVSIQGHLVPDQEITTNFEFTIPVRRLGKVLLFGQPLIFGKELKGEIEISRPAKFGQLSQVAFSASYTALSYELESWKSRFADATGLEGLKDLAFDVEGKASGDPTTAPTRPDLGVTAGLAASYQVANSPIFLEGKAGYNVTLPASGPLKAEPSFEFKIKFVIR